jgi:YHS domain-containing protein
MLTAAMILLAAVALAAEPKDDAKAREQVAVDKAALKPIQTFVGGWRGVGIPDRGKSDGAWGEDANWAWSFDGGRAAIVFDAADGKVYKSGRITAGEKAGTFNFAGTLPDGKTTEAFTGSLNAEGQLVFTTDKPTKDRPAEISIRTVAKGARMILLYRKPSPAGGKDLVRLAEVGYTRKGSGFGISQKDNECIVTGGEGTIKVEHNGKTYYVCCKGCLDEFKENPEKVLAEFKLRKDEEAKKRAKEGK